MRIKVFKLIQNIATFFLIIGSTLVLGGSDYHESWEMFLWQCRSGIALVLLCTSIIGCMHLLIQFEVYRNRMKRLKNVNKKVDKLPKRW